MSGYFEDVCICTPPSTVGMREPAGWLTWTCPSCRQRWDLEHFNAKDGRYLGYSWILGRALTP